MALADHLMLGVVILWLSACGVIGQTFYWSSYTSQGLTSVPSNLPFQTSSLSLSKNSISTLRKNDFERLLTCTRLNISHNLISKIEKGAFKGLKFLNVLDLSFNRISSLIEGSFLGMPKLRNLLLEANLLSNPEAGLLTELTNLPILAYLDLSGNNITYLKTMMFSNVTSLEILGLQENYINTIENDTFFGLSNLRKLFMHTHSLVELRGDMFRGLESLSLLAVQVGQISFITENTFANLNKIEKLFLSGNLLQQLNSTNFLGLHSLRAIYLKYNNIHNIEPKTFRNNQNMTILNLTYNSLEVLRRDIFVGLESLKELDVTNNSVSSVEVGSFSELNQLSKLNLSRNLLTELTLGLFDGLYSLKILRLDYNFLTELSLDSFRGLKNSTNLSGLYSTTKSSLTDLQELNLQNNVVTSIEPGTFIELKNISSLSLENNKLTVLHGHAFIGLQSLQEMVLSGNGINVIQPGTFYGLENLRKLQLDDNDLTVLTLGMFSGLHTLEMLSARKSKITTLEERCFKDLELLEELYLGGNNVKIDKNNSFYGLRSLKKLNLSSNALSYIEPHGFKDLTNLSLLDLSHNNLLTLEKETFYGLQSLRTLDLQNNVLQELKNNSFHDLLHLQYLFLHDNNLTTLNREAFALFTFRTGITLKISLSGNPVKCDNRLCWLLVDIDRYKITWYQEAGSYVNYGMNCSGLEIDCSIKLRDDTHEWTIDNNVRKNSDNIVRLHNDTHEQVDTRTNTSSRLGMEIGVGIVAGVVLLFGLSVLIVLCERHSRWFACLRRKRRLLLNDTEDYSLYDDVEGHGQGQSQGHSFQSNENPSSLLSNSLHVSTADMLESEPTGGSTASLRSTSSIAWSSVTYFESGRRNSDSAFPYYSVPPCYMKYESSGQKRTRSLDNLYENTCIGFLEHTYYNRTVNERDNVLNADDSDYFDTSENTQNHVQPNKENNVALNCDGSPTNHEKETVCRKTAIPNEKHRSSSEEPNNESERGSGGIDSHVDEYNSLGFVDTKVYSDYSDYCHSSRFNHLSQEDGSFVETGSRSTSSDVLDRRSSVQEYDVLGVAMETCYATESDDSGSHLNEKELSSLSEARDFSSNQYTFLGHVAITSYTDHDLNSESRNEWGEEYATTPDKEPSELGSVCSIGSVNSIGSVESIGSVDSVFSSNSSTDVESLLESDEEQNDDSNNVEYCNDLEPFYDEIGSINENPFKNDSKRELENDYEVHPLKTMGLEVHCESWNSDYARLKATGTETNTNTEQLNGQSFSEDKNITEAGDFEMKTLRDDKSKFLKLDKKEDCFVQESNESHEEATSNGLQMNGQPCIWKTEIQMWNELYDEIQKCKSFNTLRKMLQGKDDIFHGIITQGILPASQMREIDEVAKEVLPYDVPQTLVPIAVNRDGNCFTRAISMAIYGTEEYHGIIRTKILIEGALKKHRYLNEDYLRLGTNPQQTGKILSCVFAEFSGNYKPMEMNQKGQTERDIANMVETVYKRDTIQIRKLGSEMGMWQIFQASNVLGRPIVSVFPMRGNPKYRNYFNRTVFPRNKEHRCNQPLTIMWTPSTAGGPINHFVPLLSP